MNFKLCGFPGFSHFDFFVFWFFFKRTIHVPIFDTTAIATAVQAIGSISLPFSKLKDLLLEFTYPLHERLVDDHVPVVREAQRVGPDLGARVEDVVRGKQARVVAVAAKV